MPKKFVNFGNGGLFKYSGRGGSGGGFGNAGNHTGIKGNKGGKLKRYKFGIDFSQFEELAEELEALGGNIEEIFASVLEDIGEEVQIFTLEAMDPVNLPAKGVYSRGTTRKSVVLNPKAAKAGPFITVNLGFDKSKPGAGTFLITGTPRMAPDYMLEVMYTQKGFSKGVAEAIREGLEAQLENLL